MTDCLEKKDFRTYLIWFFSLFLYKKPAPEVCRLISKMNCVGHWPYTMEPADVTNIKIPNKFHKLGYNLVYKLTITLKKYLKIK